MLLIKLDLAFISHQINYVFLEDGGYHLQMWQEIMIEIDF